MPFNRKPQKFNAAIKSVVIGSGDKTVTLGGENVLPFYAFDGEIKNGPKVGVEITDLGMEGEPESVKAYYEGAATMGENCKKSSSYGRCRFPLPSSGRRRPERSEQIGRRTH